MATQNKAVTTYLPSDVEQYLTEYCTKNGLIRKDKDGNEKASLGTGIVEVLRDYFSITADETSKSHLMEQVELAVMEKVKDLVSDFEGRLIRVESKVDYLVKDLVIESDEKEVNDSVSSEVSDSTEDTTGQFSLPLTPENPPIESEVDLELTDIKLNGRRLAERLSVSNPEITKQVKKGVKSFRAFSQRKDPDGIKWEFDSMERGRKYHPVKDLDSNVLSKLLVWCRDNVKDFPY